MKAYQRRALGITSWCNLDVWDMQTCCWRKTSKPYDDEAQARKAATKQGRYRISKNNNGIRTELEPFTIEPDSRQNSTASIPTPHLRAGGDGRDLR